MSRKVDNPRIILLDCPLEYKKGESQTSVEMTAETDFTRLLQIEEEHVKELCADILALRPDVVITEKGVSDPAQHYLVKAGVTCLRRVKKSDNNRLARACGATICNHTEELKESDVGMQAGLFEVKKPLPVYPSLSQCIPASPIPPQPPPVHPSLSQSTPASPRYSSDGGEDLCEVVVPDGDHTPCTPPPPPPLVFVSSSGTPNNNNMDPEHCGGFDEHSS
ncbi:hypothetical protein O3P69_014120 [Scylla paramamosain]|uniref:T-complex protein 1 subunit gamma n=1 Tax=Scylla paramamosain TaxID=85552 RepID=A0AAW0SE87_SCYPA